jgi:hypothetical protein
MYSDPLETFFYKGDKDIQAVNGVKTSLKRSLNLEANNLGVVQEISSLL